MKTAPRPIRVPSLPLRDEAKAGRSLRRFFAKMLLVGALGVAGLSLSACERPEDQALFRAVHEGRAEEILRLIDEGADVNARDAAFWSTPLHAAARDGDTAIAGLLIDKGADVDAMDGNGHSPLCLAAALGHAEAARLLVDRGASVKEDEACWEENPLHHAGDPLRAAASGGYTDTILLLLERGARVNEPGLGGDTALHAAARRGHVQAARVLLAAGTPMKADEHGDTPLHEAVRSGNAEAVRLLLAAGAKADAIGSGKVTAWHEAVMKGHEEVLRVLREAGAAEDDLFSAVYGEGSEAMRRLLAAGAEVGKAEPLRGWTPLHLAAWRGRADLVELLLGAGAEVNAGGFVGTPLHWALRNTREVENSPEPQDAADLLWALREGSNRFVQLPTPTAADRLRVVQVLLSAGANPNALSDEGETPLDMAKAAQAAGQAGMEDVIHLLSRVTGTPAAPEQQGGQPSEQQGQETSQSPSQSPSQQPSPGPAATVRVGMPLSEALALLRSRPDLASLEPFDGDVVTDEGEVLYLATFKTGDDALLITARRSGESGAPGVTALTLWRNGTREVHQAKRYRNGALEPLDAFPR